VTPKNLRAMVRDEVRAYLESNSKVMSRLMGAIADQLGPAIEKEIARGILTVTGQLEPSERERVIGTLADARDWMAKIGAARADLIDQFDVELGQLDNEIYQLRNPQRSPDTSSPAAPPTREGGQQ
jgi:class 3 adenylate cyclase